MRDSLSRRKGIQYPLYWTAYEQSYVTDAPMPEDKFKANIDWVAETLLPYGYNMVTTDGWLGGSTVTNENGYLVKYNDEWEHDWQYWADYIKSKGLVPGVYYNPMWVADSAAEDSSKLIVGTDIPVADITVSGWADASKEGCKEYMEGYVTYFKNMGYKFLRVDFISWYESGPSAGAPEGSAYFGTESYVKALSWISEAAGDDMEVSLVMPNSYNHSENENAYGDLMRIATDTTNGDWTWLNYGSFGDQRQTWQPGFSQWANPFQGFTCYADLSGRGGLALDGDFLRLSGFNGTFSSRGYAGALADYEKKTNINLFTMAGSPFAVASQVDTIGDNLSYLINEEILQLKQEGFAGKPLFYNRNPFEPAASGLPDTGSRDSEIWMGQAANGDWIIGLFNRWDDVAEKSIDFTTTLGLKSGGYVRDMWEHTDIGLMTAYSVELQPHQSVLLRVVPKKETGQAVRYEAEVATFRGGVRYNNDHPYSGNGFVDGLSGDNPGASIVFAVSAEETAAYEIALHYANASTQLSTGSLEMIQEDGSVTDQAVVEMPPLETWDDWGDAAVQVQLQQGINLVVITRRAEDLQAFNLDYIDVKKI